MGLRRLRKVDYDPHDIRTMYCILPVGVTVCSDDGASVVYFLWVLQHTSYVTFLVHSDGLN